jgi:uncharacterized protein (UPF0548 family)
MGPLLTFRRPSEAGLRRILDDQGSQPLTYEEAGATRSQAPPGYRGDRWSVDLGSGDQIFALAADALRNWAPQTGAGMKVRPAGPVGEEGQTVVIAMPLMPIWVTVACRVVWIDNSPNRFGFAYGTLPLHAERGEEAFVIEQDEQGMVRFLIEAFSRPASLLVKAVGPAGRLIQIMITRRYLRGMRNAVTAGPQDNS